MTEQSNCVRPLARWKHKSSRINGALKLREDEKVGERVGVEIPRSDLFAVKLVQPVLHVAEGAEEVEAGLAQVE